MALEEKSVIKIHPLETMIGCTRCCANRSALIIIITIIDRIHIFVIFLKCKIRLDVNNKTLAVK